MIAFLWSCMVIFFKGCLGSILFSISLALIALIFGGGIALIASLLGRPPKPPEKKSQTWQEWKDKQDGELKSLVDEIDKDLENETES